MDLVKSVSCVACVATVLECLWPLHVLLDLFDALRVVYLITARHDLVETADLQLGSLVP